VTPSVTIAIVHYETPELLERCLTAVERSEGSGSFEVVVVDNASRSFDASRVQAAHPLVTVIVNDRNEGFARASNQALRAGSGEYLLLLNPDTLVEPRAIGTIRDHLAADPTIGCATARVLLPDGRLDLACRRSFPTPEVSLYRVLLLSRLFPMSRRFGRYNLTFLPEDKAADIDAPCGAFMMVPRRVVERVGLLDERFFMYGEDLDWAFRIKHAGWRVAYFPDAVVHHEKRASSRRHRAQTIRWFHDAMRLFYELHYKSRYPRVVTLLVYAAIAGRERIEQLAAAARSRARSSTAPLDA